MGNWSRQVAAAAVVLATASTGADAAAAAPREGEVIRIGYVNNEGGVVSLPEFRIGGEVAVDYINADGGVDGAEIELVTCASDATPEGSVNCANRLVDEGVTLVYVGIDVASDAALPVYGEAGIPFVSSNSWGSAQRSDPNATILHSALATFAVAPLLTLSELDATRVAVITDTTPAGRDFWTDIVQPIGEELGFDLVEVPVSTGGADYTQAVTTAMASSADAIMASLDEAGCVGLVTATSTLGFSGAVMPGSCSAFIDVLGEAAVGTYVFSDQYDLSTREFAPPEIQANLDIYEAAMTEAGQEDLLGGFASVPFSALMELRSILETIDGPINPASIAAAFDAATATPGFLGGELHCGAPPIASEPAHCKAEFLAFEVVLGDDGAPRKVPVGDGGFQDAAALLG